MQQLLLWNNTNYTATLSNTFGMENIITNGDDLTVALHQPEKFSSLIVLCELNWAMKGEATNRQQLQGIEIVKELRRKYELKIPVLFVSFHSLTDIFNAEREILTAIGHDFYQLPALPQDFKTFITKEFSENGTWRKLSVMELNDIKSFYCSKEGILSHELHALSSSNTEEQFLEVIRKIHELFLEDDLKVRTQFQTAFNERSREKTVEWIKEVGNNLLERYDGNANSKQDNQAKFTKQPWKVLLLDDEINESHELVQCMKSNGVDLICVDNATEAKQVLLKDWKTENRIMVVIADYRLYEKKAGVKRHQKIQGYQFLKEIASTDHLVRLVAFSGLQRKFLLNSFKHYNIRTEVKSKIDYLKSPQIFSDEIVDLAEENWEAVEAMPLKNSGFKNSLKRGYTLFRSSPEYFKMENNISKDAIDYLEKLKKQNFEKPIFIENISSVFESIKPSKKSKETKVKCDECGTLVPEYKVQSKQTDKGLPTKFLKNPDGYFNDLMPYFVARRVALWFYANSKQGIVPIMDMRKFAELLTGIPYHSQKEKYKENSGAYRQIFSTNLGISFDDFPKNITIEERRWLQYEMQINIFRDINLMIPALAKVAKNYKDFFLTKDFLKEQIKKGKFAVTHKYKQTNYTIDFSKDFTPDIKTASDVRVLFLWIAEQSKKVKTKTEYVEIIKPLVSRLRHSLFESRNEVVYLINLFEYFNGYYRILNKEQSNLTNPTAKIKDKSGFEKKSAPALNKSFERVHELLGKEEFPTDTDKADDWKIYITGEKVVAKFGRKILDDKAKFFSELTKAINEESKFIGGGLDEGRTGNQNNDEEDNEDLSDEDFPDFADDGEED